MSKYSKSNADDHPHSVFEMPESLIRRGNYLAQMVNVWQQECHAEGYKTYVTQSTPMNERFPPSIRFSFTVELGKHGDGK